MVISEEQIDLATLRLVQESDLQRLIPVTGPRVKFRCHLEEWRQRLKAATSTFNVEPETFSEGDILDISQKILEATGYNNENTLPLDFYQGEEFIEDQATQEAKKQRIEGTTHRTDFGSTSQGSSCLTDYNKTYVETVLSKSVEGKALIQSGKTGKLNDKQKRLLGKILITDILTANPDKRLTETEYTQLGLAINSLFPKEPVALYYSVSLDHTAYSTKRLARGILLQAWNTRRRQLRQLGEVKYTPRKKSTSSANSSPFDSPIGTPLVLHEDIDEVEDEKLKTLRSTIEPWSVVEAAWRDTTATRLKKLEKGNTTLDEYFTEYPALKQPLGFRLLCDDFSFTFPNKDNSLTSSLLIMRDQLIRIATDKATNTRDKDLKDTVRAYLEKITDDKLDSKSEIALILLPYILSLQPSRKKSGTLAWKPSRSEVRDGFITHVTCAGDVRSTIQERKNKLTRLGRTFQPLIIVVGESIVTYSVCHVIINDTIYQLPTLLKAVDTAFQIFHATGAKYPSESEDVWLVVQRLLYSIETKFDRLNQTVSSLLAEFNLLQ
ncbi:hypothetical protein PPYR_02164 [Photinus pyralis]|uniref:Uncharacterized protein n=1 Tax=Photinus pyralis TaxID=7054 RepID=A0A5N4B6L5_PHOPY|nr:hypothetical protein PPYR_02164 [Photinus pyralis]